MDNHQESDAESHNVIGDLRGREKPDEIVIVGGHRDTWALGRARARRTMAAA
jgi:hypothetical protein